MKLDSFPLLIGPMDEPHNPAGLPDTLPFSIGFDAVRGALIQHPSAELPILLDRAYLAGVLLGTPLTDDSFGKPYADDFLEFIHQTVLAKPGKALEIGAGVGYITRRLMDAGWRAIGIEPGKGYANHWNHYGVEIINEFFPHPEVPGPFDLISCYAVLEHISDPLRFLKDIRDRLTPTGMVVVSVPNCTEEIEEGDPAILLHEHYNYFNTDTLRALFWQAGFRTIVQKSKFGRCLFVAGHNRSDAEGGLSSREDLAILQSYPQRVEQYIKKIQLSFAKIMQNGSVGIYCPARALAVLDKEMPLRFFDDDQTQKGKFLPPFPSPIEDRESLLAKPVKTVVIMSRTFGQRIRDSLRQSGYQGSVLTVNELI